MLKEFNEINICSEEEIKIVPVIISELLQKED